MTTKEWLIKTKAETASLEIFITKLEMFVSDTGLNCAKFEAAVDTGLAKIESDQKKSFIPDVNA